MPHPQSETASTVTTAETEVVSFVQDLIRIRSINTGDPTTVGDGELTAARYVRARLDEVGLESTILEPIAGRANVWCRLTGTDSSAPALVFHAHLDVVPADDSEWSVPPYGGEIRDGVLYGRGAVDMKNMAGMMLAVARQLKRNNLQPRRDIVFAWFADEENGGVYGSQYLSENHPEVFAGVTEAITEGGGFSITLPNGKRAYLLATAEKGAIRVKLTARGTAGHGALVHDDNPVTRIAAAVDRVGSHVFPIVKTSHSQALLDGLEKLIGKPFDENDLDAELEKLGFVAKSLRASLRNTANPTLLSAGYKRNVVPSTAEATIDCRILPGSRDQFVAELTDLIGPNIDIDWTFGWTIESPVTGELVDAMRSAIETEDPDGTLVPYLLPGGTDNKLLSKIGIFGYGFVPLRVPEGFDVWGLFHAVDERVPVDSLAFGTRVLEHLITDL